MAWGLNRTLLSVVVAGALVLSACGDDSDEPSDSADADDAGADEEAGADAGFPLTVEHRYGTTEIAEVPETVVTVGLTDHDALLALGVTPAGVTEWYGEQPYATWPWAQDELGDAEPEVVGDSEQANYEAIASLQPDVILALYAGLTQEQYDTLSAIAPTVTAPEEFPDYGIPWQEQTRIIGQVVGRTDEAEDVIAETEGLVADLAAEHPELDGATVALAATGEELVSVYGPNTAVLRVLQDLGLTMTDELLDLIGDDWGTEVSPEQIDLLDTDTLIWLDVVDDEGPLANPVYTALPVHTEGREVRLQTTGPLAGGSFISPLSLPAILEQLVPMLSAAVDGDTSTEVPAEEA